MLGFWRQRWEIPHPSRHALVTNLRSCNETNPRLQSHVSTFSPGKYNVYRRRSKDGCRFK